METTNEKMFTFKKWNYSSTGAWLISVDKVKVSAKNLEEAKQKVGPGWLPINV